jgi:type IV secretory pathway protease TraF
VVALIAMVNALGLLVLFVASQVPVPLLVYGMGLSTVVGLLAIVVSPPVYAPPTDARLEAEDRLRHNG